MKRRSVLLAPLVSGCIVAACANGAFAAPLPFDDSKALTYDVRAAPLTAESAPADEYFGRAKLSNLGVKNIIHDITVEGNSPLAVPRQVGRIQAVGWAMADWADKYPRDHWLPSAMIKFATLLQSKHQPSYDQAAISMLYLVANRYARTWFGKYAVGQLQKYDELANVDMLNSPDVNEFANVIDYTLPTRR
jgi:hypothetical protein